MAICGGFGGLTGLGAVWGKLLCVGEAMRTRFDDGVFLNGAPWVEGLVVKGVIVEGTLFEGDEALGASEGALGVGDGGDELVGVLG